MTLAIYKTTLTVTATALAVHAAIRCMEGSLTLMKVEERGEREGELSCQIHRLNESHHARDLLSPFSKVNYMSHDITTHTRVRNRLNLLPKDK